eukprot:m.164556 g.164556  ORF g.164556 m.164556 type:complete len:687 (+) comp17139_c0_seq1:31-2091(+)
MARRSKRANKRRRLQQGHKEAPSRKAKPAEEDTNDELQAKGSDSNSNSNSDGNDHKEDVADSDGDGNNSSSSHSEDDAENDNDDDSDDAALSERDLAAATAELEKLVVQPDVFLTAPAFKVLRSAIYPLIKRQLATNAHFEFPFVPAGQSKPKPVAPSPAGIAALLRAISYFCSEAGSDAFASPEAKAFRRAMHPVVLEAKRRAGGRVHTAEQLSLSSRISAAFRCHEWEHVVVLLRALAQSDERPRLGAMQRWVRSCDMIDRRGTADEDISDNDAQGEEAGQGEEEDGGSRNGSGGARNQAERKTEKRKRTADGAGVDVSKKPPKTVASAPLNNTSDSSVIPLSATSGMSWRLLDAVIHACKLRPAPQSSASTTAATASSASAVRASTPAEPSVCGDVRVVYHPPFVFRNVLAEGKDKTDNKTADDNSSDEVVASADIAAAMLADKRLVLHVKGPQRTPPSDDDLSVWVLPSIRELSDAAWADVPPVTRHEVPNVPGAFLLANLLSKRQCARLLAAMETLGYVRDGTDGIGAVVWLALPEQVQALYNRCAALLPPGSVGINARFRLFRYSPGAVYRPHIDGAWPGSGLDAEGRLDDDLNKGRTMSRSTFLIYLNDVPDAGGHTTFFLPAANSDTGIDAFGVEPAGGSALVFPHGNAEGALVHEGSAVLHGVKYVLRTDVLYARQP